MCRYRSPGLAAALARGSAGLRADPPGGHRPGVADTSCPTTEEHRVGVTNADQVPQITIVEETLR